MDWFHCWRCFRQEGARFAVTTCGHILCEDCGGTGPCPVCATACHYLPLSQQMHPEVKVFFKNPADLALKHLAHITKVCQFQLAQAQLKVDAHQDTARRAQAEVEKAREELGEMRRKMELFCRENAELRRMQPVPVQPRRQLSSQVVSRLSSLEPPRSRSTPGWQGGVAYRDSGTPLASSMGEQLQILQD
ncbi:hypothetical protein Nmel_018833, partial [Mimus melanotis]